MVQVFGAGLSVGSLGLKAIQILFVPPSGVSVRCRYGRRVIHVLVQVLGAGLSVRSLGLMAILIFFVPPSCLCGKKSLVHSIPDTILHRRPSQDYKSQPHIIPMPVKFPDAPEKLHDPPEK